MIIKLADKLGGKELFHFYDISVRCVCHVKCKRFRLTHEIDGSAKHGLMNRSSSVVFHFLFELGICHSIYVASEFIAFCDIRHGILRFRVRRFGPFLFCFVTIWPATTH